MRITNMMMSNSMLTRINKNMNSLDTYYTQMSSGKKIQMPSEDPIVASRALKLRNMVSSTEQYNSNADQGLSWMEATESAFSNMNSILTTMSELSVQGASDQYKEDDRKKILNQFNSLVSQLETELNSTYMGRYLFSGYKTDKPAIIQDAITGKKILNPEVYEYGDIPADKLAEAAEQGIVKKVNDLTTQIAELNGKINAGDTSVISDRDKLINQLKNTIDSENMELQVSSNNQVIKLVSKPTNNTSNNNGVGVGTLNLQINLVIEDTGYPISVAPNNSNDDVSFSGTDGTKFPLEVPKEDLIEAGLISEGRIKLEVGVNNYIEINSLATETYTTEMYDNLHYFEKVYDYMEGTLSQEDMDTYFGGKAFADLSETEVVSFDTKIRSEFESMIAKVNSYNESITEQQTNLGVRMNRITLIQERLGDDKVNYTNLMSKNEDVNYADVAMKFNVANATYQASLKTGMTITQLTLADFL